MFEKYRAKIELKKRTSGLNPEKRIEYLKRILSKKSMLTQNTRDAAYSLLGDTYLKIGEKEFKYNRDNKEIIDAAESYARAGEYKKSVKLVPNDVPFEKMKYKPTIEQFREVYDIINIEDRKRNPENYDYMKYIQTKNPELYDYIIEHRERKKNKGLEEKVTPTTAIIGILGGLIFLSLNITGNVIGNSGAIGNLVGVGLLIIGLLAGFFWIKKNKELTSKK